MRVLTVDVGVVFWIDASEAMPPKMTDNRLKKLIGMIDYAWDHVRMVGCPTLERARWSVCKRSEMMNRVFSHSLFSHFSPNHCFMTIEKSYHLTNTANCQTT